MELKRITVSPADYAILMHALDARITTLCGLPESKYNNQMLLDVLQLSNRLKEKE